MTTTDLRSFFHAELRRSIWFLLTGAGLGGAILLGLSKVGQHWERSQLTSNAFVLLGLAMAVAGWYGIATEFRRIQKLDIEWEKVDPAQPIHAVLESTVRLIQTSTLTLLVVVGVFMCS